jgi:chromosome segregation ATPase
VAAAEAERLAAEVATLGIKVVDLDAEVVNLGAEVSRLTSLVTQREGEKRDLESRLNADDAQAALSLELDAARAESRAVLEQAVQAEAALQAVRTQLEEQEVRARAALEAAAAAAEALAAQEEEVRRLEAIGGTERALQSQLDEAAAALEARLAEVADMKERVEVNRKKAERIEQAMFEKEAEVEEAHQRNEKLEEKLYGISGKPTSGKLASGLEKAGSMLDKKLQKKQAMFADMASAIQDKERQVRRRAR